MVLQDGSVFTMSGRVAQGNCEFGSIPQVEKYMSLTNWIRDRAMGNVGDRLPVEGNRQVVSRRGNRLTGRENK